MLVITHVHVLPLIDNACSYCYTYLFVAMVMLMMVVVVVSPAMSPVEPTIATVRVEHCNKHKTHYSHFHTKRVIYGKRNYLMETG